MGLFRADSNVVYKPANEVDLTANSSETYLPANVKAPRMAGFLIKLFVWLLESWILGKLLFFILKGNNLIHKLVSYADIEESPIYTPFNSFEDVGEKAVKCAASDSSPPERVQMVTAECMPSSSPSEMLPKSASFRRWSISDYSRAYISGEITPTMVAELFIKAVHESANQSMKMSFFIDYDANDILQQAIDSTLRHQQGKPISSLDGVLIGVKDEIDCKPYPTTGGTKWLHKQRRCTEDACCVKRLRLCGAILVGKTNMHELGAGTSGINPHYGATRNPYNPGKISGGSSSGSAAVVAAGLCPVSLGVDGGGSVRLPAALCGVVGFKPTFGRVPHSGVLPLNWTVGMIGVLSNTVEDALIVYAAISGGLPSQQFTTMPSLYFPILNKTTSLSDIKMAKYDEWFNDCSDDIRTCCSDAVQMLEKCYGWETIGVTIPDIEAMRLAHYITMGSECTTAMSSYIRKMSYSELGWDARVALAIYGAFSGKEYIKAQKMRNRQMQIHEKIFAQADVIVAPTTGVTAYSLQDDALKTGELDYINGAALVRFSIAGNFLGYPAITIPVGYDKTGLPIGLQFIGRHWSEATLLHIAYALEAIFIPHCKKPQVFYDMLKTQ